MNSNAKRPICAATVGRTSNGTELRSMTVTAAFLAPSPTKSRNRSDSEADVFRLLGLSTKSYRTSLSLLSMRIKNRSKSPNMGPG